jgi:hypothetical protein
MVDFLYHLRMSLYMYIYIQSAKLLADLFDVWRKGNRNVS